MLYALSFMLYALCFMFYASYWNNAKNAHAHPQKPVLARPSWPARPPTRTPARPRTPAHTRAFPRTLLCARLKLRKYEKVC